VSPTLTRRVGPGSEALEGPDLLPHVLGDLHDPLLDRPGEVVDVARGRGTGRTSGRAIRAAACRPSYASAFAGEAASASGRRPSRAVVAAATRRRPRRRRRSAGRDHPGGLVAGDGADDLERPSPPASTVKMSVSPVSSIAVPVLPTAASWGSAPSLTTSKVTVAQAGISVDVRLDGELGEHEVGGDGRPLGGRLGDRRGSGGLGRGGEAGEGRLRVLHQRGVARLEVAGVQDGPDQQRRRRDEQQDQDGDADRQPLRPAVGGRGVGGDQHVPTPVQRINPVGLDAASPSRTPRRRAGGPVPSSRKSCLHHFKGG
jgi:hypothetical protein